MKIDFEYIWSSSGIIWIDSRFLSIFIWNHWINSRFL